MLKLIQEIFYFPVLIARQWELLWSFVRRELQARYKGSVLGLLWPVLHPICLFVIYYLIFAKLLKIPVSVDLGPWAEAEPGKLLDAGGAAAGWRSTFFLISGILPWIAVSESLMRSTGIVLENANLIKKIAFPSEFLPTFVVILNHIYFLVGFLLFTIIELAVNGSLPIDLMWFPLILVLQMLFLLGLCMLVGAVNIFIRDVAQIVPLFTMFWMFASPVFYEPKVLAMLGDEKQKGFVETIMPYLPVNPVYNLLTLYRDIFKYGRDTTIEVLGPGQYKVAAVAHGCGISYDCLLIFAVQAVLSFLIGYAVFVSAKGRFADEV